MADPVTAAAAAFPVVFFDGDQEVDIGTIAVTPTMAFKKFQAVICQRIGLSPHQISTSLVRRKKARSSPEVRRKVPIDESSDFASIARERDCFILAVLRRSRRERRGRSRRSQQAEMISSMPPERTILKRNPDPPILTAAAAAAELGLGLGLWGGYESQLLNLQKQRERYLISTAAYHPYTLSGDAHAALVSSVAAVCGECEAATAKGAAPPPFHWCVRDAVTVGFRSPAGPIQRPSKASA